MMCGSFYLGKLYHDLITNSPQIVTMSIPAELGSGQISQTTIKHGVILSDWQMNYRSDMNVHGPVSREYIQIVFCLNDGISWGIMNEHRSVTIQKNESCIYAGHGGTEHICYTKDSHFSFKSIKIPISYFTQLLSEYFDGQETAAYERKLLDGISKVPVTPMMEQIFSKEVSGGASMTASSWTCMTMRYPAAFSRSIASARMSLAVAWTMFSTNLGP